MLNLMRSSIISRSRESVRRLERLILEEGNRDILECWTLFMCELREDLDQSEERLAELTDRINRKERLHQEDLSFFEDVLTQMEEDHNKELEKERESARRNVSEALRELRELRTELAAREYELEKTREEVKRNSSKETGLARNSLEVELETLKEREDLEIVDMELKTELMQRIHSALGKSARTIKISQDKECHEEELRALRDKLKLLEKELEETKTTLAEESEKCFQEGVRVGRKIAAIEEMGVLEELEMLKELGRTLECRLERTDSEITLQSMVIIDSNGLQVDEESFS